MKSLQILTDLTTDLSIWGSIVTRHQISRRDEQHTPDAWLDPRIFASTEQIRVMMTELGRWFYCEPKRARSTKGK